MNRLLFLLLCISVLEVPAQEAGQRLAFIDSLARHIDTAGGHTLTFAEGPFWYRGDRKSKGNVYVTYTRDSATHALLKVTEDQSLQVTELTTYYYHHNRLILVRTAAYPLGVTAAPPQAEGVYYFEGTSLLYKWERNLTRLPAAYLQLAQEYLKESGKVW